MIAVLVAVSLAAPLENPADHVAPIAASTVSDKPVPIQEPQDKVPIAQPITNQPVQEPDKIEGHSQISNNLNQPESKPVLNQNEKEPLILDDTKPAQQIQHEPVPVQETHIDKNPLSVDQPITSQPVHEPEKIEDHSQALNNLNLPEAKPILAENIKPEVDVPPPDHHVQEHVLNERPEKPTLEPVIPDQKPGLEEDNEDSDEDLDLFQALGLLALNYELELLEEMEQLENKNAHQSHGHKNDHKHQQNHGHSHGHYTPNREDLPCDCKYLGEVLPEVKHGRKH